MIASNVMILDEGKMSWQMSMRFHRHLPYHTILALSKKAAEKNMIQFKIGYVNDSCVMDRIIKSS